MKNHRLRPAAVPPLPLCTSALLLLALLAGCAHHRVPPQRETDYDAVVIGAGMGGLSAAAHLATAGMKVLVLEQHHKVGGVTTSFARGDFRFETALHEMDGAGPEGPIRTLLADVGVLDKIELIPIPALYRSIFPDVQLTVPTDPEAARTAFAERWPEEREAIDRYFEMLTRLRNDVDELKDLYRSSPTGRFFRILGVPFGQSAFFSIYRKTLQTVLDDLFVAPLLKAVISQFWVYYGPPPTPRGAPRPPASGPPSSSLPTAATTCTAPGTSRGPPRPSPTPTPNASESWAAPCSPGPGSRESASKMASSAASRRSTATSTPPATSSPTPTPSRPSSPSCPNRHRRNPGGRASAP